MKYLVQLLINILVFYFQLQVPLHLQKRQLYDKAVKALYSLKRNILSLNPSIYTSLHIFDHTVKPILLYGSEIWLCSFSKKDTIHDLFNYSKISKSFNSEKLHIHFCKYILGVHKKALILL